MEHNYTPYKIDKNGTKYFSETVKCQKCGGSGYISYYGHVEGGICFDCGGSGFVVDSWKEYTPEYEEKLNAKRQAKRDKEIAKAKEHSDEHNQKFFEKQGFNAEGKCWVVLGDTFNIKDELKAVGAHWENILNHWTLNHEDPNYPTFQISVDDLYTKDYTDRYFWNNWKTLDKEVWDKLTLADMEVRKSGINEDALGEVGSKFEIDTVLDKIAFYDTQFGVTCVYTFHDDANHQIVWKTSNSICKDDENGTGIYAKVGDKVHLKGTVKEVSEYRGIKQTKVTRCKATF